MKTNYFAILACLIFLFEVTSFAHEDTPHGSPDEKAGETIGVCPVMKGKTQDKYSVEYEGKTYKFCCPGCINKFKNNPEKYISKIKEINFEAFQYGFKPDPVIVKKGDIVKLLITSRDIPHGIFIEKYDVNISVKKGEAKKVEFIADKVGEFNIVCSIYCGPGHSRMKGKLIVKE